MSSMDTADTVDAAENVDLKREPNPYHVAGGHTFRKGNPGKPAGIVKPLHTMRAYREAIRDATTPEELTAMIQELLPYAVAQFKEGQPAGFKVLLEQMCGKPVAVKEQDQSGANMLELVAEKLGAK